MGKILYLMNVDWNWIKQRPQFLAEELSHMEKVVCITPQWYNRRGLQRRRVESGEIVFRRFYGLPGAGKLLAVKRLNAVLRRWLTRLVCAFERPDVIYITYPDQYSPWMKRARARVLYDCMDNLSALSGSEAGRQLVESQERALLGAADIVLATSENIRRMLVERYGVRDEIITVVRNGYSGTISHVEATEKREKPTLDIGYVGTVSSWMDFDLLKRYADAHDDVVFHIVGPVRKDVKPPEHPRILMEGTVEHDQLWEKIRDYDALMMPFVVNEIIEAVDPVKLYEYINFNKPILCVRYREVERFEPFVHFYNGYEAFERAVEQARGPLKYSAEARRAFLEQSTWRSRARTIVQIIEQGRRA